MQRINHALPPMVCRHSRHTNTFARLGRTPCAGFHLKTPAFSWKAPRTRWKRRTEGDGQDTDDRQRQQDSQSSRRRQNPNQQSLTRLFRKFWQVHHILMSLRVVTPQFLGSSLFLTVLTSCCSLNASAQQHVGLILMSF
jgi:hypothetical protein